MMEQLTLLAPAKINWGLAVLGKRADGYHDLSSLMQNISLYDRITMRPDTKDTCICCPDPCMGGDNLAVRAWQLMREQYHLRGGLHIVIEKNIPAGGGLAGGSADAAGVILGAARLFDLDISTQELAKLSFILGADIPFCIMGGAAVIGGAGEDIAPISLTHEWDMLLICPNISLSTAEVFSRSDSLPAQASCFDMDMLCRSVSAGDIEGISRYAVNMLEPAAFDICPEIGQIKEMLLRFGCAALMSGSGSCIWAIPPAGKADSICAALEEKSIDCRRVSTLTHGIVEI